MKNLLTILAVTGAFQSFANTTVIDSAQFYFTKGIEEKTAKRYLTASQCFEKATVFNNSYTEAYIENGYVNLEMHKTDQAKASFTKAYELQPTNPVSIKELANLYFDYRQWDKAIEFASKCTDCANSDRIIGMSQYEKEDYAQAEKYLLRYISKSPNDAQATYTLARTYLDAEMYAKAVPYFEKAVKMNPEKNTWAYELGLLYYNNNNFKSASLAFENAAAHGYPESNDFNENYGYALLYSGNFEKGEERMMAVYKKKPNKEIYRDVASALYDLKQYDRALDYCQKLLEMDANDGKALYQAGLTFQKMGQKEKGQAMCDQAIKIDPSLESLRTKKMDLSGGL